MKHTHLDITTINFLLMQLILPDVVSIKLNGGMLFWMIILVLSFHMTCIYVVFIYLYDVGLIIFVFIGAACLY